MPNGEMSDDELTHEFWRVWNSEGPSGLLRRYDDFFTDDLEWRPPVSEMAARAYVGRTGFEQYAADVEESFTDIRGELEEVTEIEPDLVRSRVRMHGEGTSSGVPVDAPLIGLSRIRDGRMYWGWASYDLATAEKVAHAIARGEEVEV